MFNEMNENVSFNVCIKYIQLFTTTFTYNFMPNNRVEL